MGVDADRASCAQAAAAGASIDRKNTPVNFEGGQGRKVGHLGHLRSTPPVKVLIFFAFLASSKVAKMANFPPWPPSMVLATFKNAPFFVHGLTQLLEVRR
jgi:hypothetical protein